MDEKAGALIAAIVVEIGLPAARGELIVGPVGGLGGGLVVLTPPRLAGGEGDGGIVLTIEYGAQWELVSEPGDAATIGYRTVGLTPTIPAGTTWSAPPAWIGAFDGDLDGAAAITTDYLRAAVVPQGPDDFPWVQYNTWFSWACELDAETLLREADLAAQLDRLAAMPTL